MRNLTLFLVSSALLISCTTVLKKEDRDLGITDIIRTDNSTFDFLEECPEMAPDIRWGMGRPERAIDDKVCVQKTSVNNTESLKQIFLNNEWFLIPLKHKHLQNFELKIRESGFKNPMYFSKNFKLNCNTTVLVIEDGISPIISILQYEPECIMVTE